MQEVMNSGRLHEKDFQLCLDDLRKGISVASNGQERKEAVQDIFRHRSGS